MSYIFNRKVNYYETDQMAIVHHSNYIRWYEEARIAYMEHIELSLCDLEKLGVQIPVLEVESKYLKTIKYGDVVKIHIDMVKYTGTRMDFVYEVYNQNGDLCNIGSSKHCFIKSFGNAISLKKFLPKIHAKFLQIIVK